MACTYIDGGNSPTTFAPGSKGCAPGQATAFDVVSGKCFKIYGVAVTIGNKAASVKGWFEVYNFNVHREGTQRAVPSNVGLNGPVVV
jgi:hypothetical protein